MSRRTDNISCRLLWKTRRRDAVFIVEAPNAESMATVALAISAAGAAQASKTSALMTGAEGVAAMTKAAAIAKTYRPAR
jgi:uncharacterized protein with GYD domain